MHRVVVAFIVLALPVLASAQESAGTTDDSHMALAPAERG